MDVYHSRTLRRIRLTRPLPVLRQHPNEHVLLHRNGEISLLPLKDGARRPARLHALRNNARCISGAPPELLAIVLLAGFGRGAGCTRLVRYTLSIYCIP